jgi:hypothetical protein
LQIRYRQRICLPVERRSLAALGQTQNAYTPASKEHRSLRLFDARKPKLIIGLRMEAAVLIV